MMTPAWGGAGVAGQGVPPGSGQKTDPRLAEPKTIDAWGDYVTVGRAQVLDGPGPSARPQGTIESGRQVVAEARTQDGAWTRVADRKLRGWVETAKLKDMQAFEAEEWERIEKGDLAALQRFLKRFPTGKHATDAKSEIAALEQKRAAERAARETPDQALTRALAANYDGERAGRIYEVAKELPDAHRFYLFGRLHESGNGLPRDPDIALSYYRLALKAGYQPAASAVARLEGANVAERRGRNTEAEPQDAARADGSAVASRALPPPAAASRPTSLRGGTSAPDATSAPSGMSTAGANNPAGGAGARAATPAASDSTMAETAGSGNSAALALRPGLGGDARRSTLPPGRPADAPTTNLPSGRASQEYDQAMSLMKEGRYREAEAAFREFAARNAGDGLAANAQFWLGEVLLLRADYDGAAESFSETVRKYPLSSKAPEALFKAAFAHGEAKRKEQACDALRELAQRYPAFANGAFGQRAASERIRLGC